MKTAFKHQFSIALLLCLTLLSGCTVALGGVGAAVGYSRQPNSEASPSAKKYRGSDGTLQSPSKPWSVGKHVALAAVAGLVIDVIIVGILISSVDAPCFGPDVCD
jgi:hypothetical protein